MYERRIDGIAHYHFFPVNTGNVIQDSKIEDNPVADLGGGDQRLKLRLSEEPEDVAVFLHLDDEAVKAALDRYDRMYLQDKSAADTAA